MTEPSPQTILRMGGFLYSGATRLGLYHSMECRVVARTKAILAEEWGQQEVGRIFCGETWILAGVLRDYNAAALAKIFPGASGSTVSWNVTSQRPGTLRTTSAISFVPRVTTQPTISFPAAVGLPDAAARFKLSLKSDLGFGVVFMAQPDASGDVYVMG